MAAATSRIRVGAGGIMLPNHSALHVAEAFRVLEALHPGRIDLGVGRAPGTDGITASALRRSADAFGAEDFPTQLGELLAYAGDGFPAGHPYESVSAIPADAPLPPLWILGSSEYGAQVAAALGVGFAFARHLNPRGAEAIMRAYRDAFRPSQDMAEPTAILTVSAIAADTPERADELATSMGLGLVRMRQGRPIAPAEPGGGGRAPVHAPRAGPDPPLPPRPGAGRRGRRARRDPGARRRHRGRRGHGDDLGSRPRRAAALLRADRRGPGRDRDRGLREDYGELSGLTGIGRPPSSTATIVNVPAVQSSRAPLAGSSRWASTLTFMLVRPTDSTRASSSTSSPWWIGTRKSRPSTAAVTTALEPARRSAGDAGRLVHPRHQRAAVERAEVVGVGREDELADARLDLLRAAAHAATISSSRAAWASISHGPTPRTADSSSSVAGAARAMPAMVRFDATRNAGQPSSWATSQRQSRSAS